MSQALEVISEAGMPNLGEVTRSASVPVSRRGLMIWSGSASLLLLASGLLRSVQAGRFKDDKNTIVTAPFPLKDIPQAVGEWNKLEGSELVLDPLTTRITGSTDHILWAYVDDRTGVKLSVLILYGPAEPVLPHTPQVCYPATGFRAVGDTIDKTIQITDRETAMFRSSIFVRSGGRTMNRTAVYHSFLYNGSWTPAVTLRKSLRRSPGIFKVQIQRTFTDLEKSDGDEPIENFIQHLLPALELKIANASSQTPLATVGR